MAEYFISTANFDQFVKALLKDSKVIAPFQQFDKLFLEEVTPDNIDKIKLSGFRSVESFKPYFFALIEKVESPVAENLIILGVRGCDLEGIEVLDRVFTEGDIKDPFYMAKREKIAIISADCTNSGETCFCTMVKGKPYPGKLFDLNLTPLEHGFVLETGTRKGEKILEVSKKLFSKVPPASLSERKKQRENVFEQVAQKNRDYELKRDLAEAHKANLENMVWKKLTKDCVECSGCNFICPTCSCFLLLDQEKNKESERYKVWDACLKSGYAKVAGGANPRGKLHERLQNRYHCKFDYSFDRLGRYTCVGCGRCIDGCAGKIDMRRVFAALDTSLI